MAVRSVVLLGFSLFLIACGPSRRHVPDGPPGDGGSGCTPGAHACGAGDTVTVCRADGSGYDVVDTCSSPLHCSGGACADLCTAAVTSRSYVGCEYWPTPTTNSVAPEFEFAVVVANPNVAPADVEVTRGGSPVANVTVAPDGIETIRLPWIDELKEPGNVDPSTGAVDPRSALARAGAYRLRSSIPVTAYQFNPLEYRIDRDCADEPEEEVGDGRCFSYSNDASLLIPTHAMTGNYIVVARATMLLHRYLRDDTTRRVIDDPATGQPIEISAASPGFAAIVGVSETPVEVSVELRANVLAEQGGAFASFAAGSTARFTLSQGDVVQLSSAAPSSCTPGDSDEQALSGLNCPPLTPCSLVMDYCSVGPEYDLTGSVISASGPVEVISGHQCAFVPYNRWACDHLEETMFPLDTWGKDFVVAATQPLRSEPNLVRVVSGADGNSITFDPPVHAPAVLNRGEMIEFEASEDFRVTGGDAIQVAQFLVGQEYAGFNPMPEEGQGDPSLSLAIPTEQFRSEYTFLAPVTYDSSFVTVIASGGQDVAVDGVAVTGWRPVGSTGMQTARVPIAGGTHHATSSRAFGIVVYGFGSYTSYMYPGGLDLELIFLI